MSSLADSPEFQAARRFLQATLMKRQGEAQVREAKEVIHAIQPSLLAHLTAAGIKSITIDGYALSPHREPRVYPLKGVSKQKVCEALKIAGLGGMVREDYSMSSLTAHVKQLEEHAKLIVGLEDADESQASALAQLLHPALAQILQIEPTFSLHVRKKESGPAYKYERATDEEEGAIDNDDD